MAEFSHGMTSVWLVWAPLVAAVLHVFEEFIFPGGFMGWYSRYRGSAGTVTNSFLWKINLLLLAGCFNAGYAGHNARNLWFWVLLVAMLGANGVWHAWASVRSRSYSPGTVTGVLVYLPLAVFGIGYLASAGALGASTWMAAGAGALYPLWSALFHARTPTASCLAADSSRSA